MKSYKQTTSSWQEKTKKNRKKKNRIKEHYELGDLWWIELLWLKLVCVLSSDEIHSGEGRCKE